METLLIELNSPKARKLIDDLVDLGIISLRTEQPAWGDLWDKLDKQLPQTEPDMSEQDILDEIKAYRAEKRARHMGL
ncbi:hypothetical protein [Spirosoma montaniterrae]|uniref:Uncharacterized protein n=1 Tax=Spirosoma montaniterrae TaxID=1178516 RepID=A0A1P9X0R3_9BACT|nr:hypothetical protein [Spirosoma montaniterrae]AQG81220.1 hypothetical protein AWR27_18985 [Spirosoma montaniterrae]